MPGPYNQCSKKRRRARQYDYSVILPGGEVVALGSSRHQGRANRTNKNIADTLQKHEYSIRRKDCRRIITDCPAHCHPHSAEPETEKAVCKAEYDQQDHGLGQAPKDQCRCRCCDAASHCESADGKALV